MKGKMKKLLAVFLLIALAVTMAPSTTSHAASPKFYKNIKIWKFSNGPKSYQSVFIMNPINNGKITKLKNTKPSVAKVTVGGSSYITIQAKSTGTTKTTFQYGGKKYTTKISVKKWVSPCKQFKIGNKDYAKSFTKSNRFELNKQKKDKKETIKIVPQKGWKLLKIEQSTMDFNTKKVKNNGKVTLSTKMTGTQVDVWFQNKKTKEKNKIALIYTANPSPSGNSYMDSLITD